MVNETYQMPKGDRSIRVVKADNLAEKRAKVKRHFKAIMLLLADLEPEDFLEVAKTIESKSLLTDLAA